MVIKTLWDNGLLSTKVVVNGGCGERSWFNRTIITQLLGYTGRIVRLSLLTFQAVGPQAFGHHPEQAQVEQILSGIEVKGLRIETKEASYLEILEMVKGIKGVR